MTGQRGRTAGAGTAVALASAAALALYGAFEKSAVMFVSAAAIAAVLCLFRRAKTRDRIIAVIAGGLGGSIGAEIVHTLYQHLGSAAPAPGGGELFASAMRVGLINAGVVLIALVAAAAWRAARGGVRS